MSREIRFRALKGGIWYVLILDYPAGITKELLERFANEPFIGFETPWLEYTGLRDKNRIMIYEGDIVRGINYNRDFITQPIIWVKSGWYAGWVDSGYSISIDSLWSLGEVEVIGNIYENPELLVSHA